MTLEEARDYAVIMQALSLLAVKGQQHTAKSAAEAFDRIKSRYNKLKDTYEPEVPYDGSRGTVKVN